MDPSVTLRVYAHVLSDQASGAADSIAAMMGESVGTAVSKAAPDGIAAAMGESTHADDLG